MGRRGWLVIAALLVAVVVGVGALSGGLPQADPVRPPPERPPTEVQRASVVLSVDVTATGTVWLTTAGVDCGGCVLVWRRGADEGDEWFPLRQVGDDHRAGQIRMTETSIDGLIGGGGLWVTSDGGDSWAEETQVPITPGDQVQVEAAGESRWALVRPSDGEPTLWRSQVGESRWRPVDLPSEPLDPEAGPVAVDGDRLLLWVAGGTGPRPVLAAPDGWEELDPPCRAGTTTAYATCSTRGGLQLLVLHGGWETWPIAAALGPARNLSPVAAAESVATNAEGTGYAVVRGNLVVTHDRGLGGWARVE